MNTSRENTHVDAPTQAAETPAQAAADPEDPAERTMRLPRVIRPSLPADDDLPPNTPQNQATVARSTQPAAAPGEHDYVRAHAAGELLDTLTPRREAVTKSPWRSMFGFGPSQKERDERRDLDSVNADFPRPVTIMVANPKGGAGKTPTTLLLAAAFGLARGGGVIAWDNNELRGTMPDRSLSPHRKTVRDLLGDIEELSGPEARFTDLANYLNHQSSGTFHTLGSAQHYGQVIVSEDFEQVHALFSRFFPVIIIDTGNNEAAPNWMAAADVADCLVVPTKWRQDSLVPAARMLETLAESHPALLKRTVIAATNGPSDTQKDVKASGGSWFGQNHPIVEIPTDPHIAEGGVIDYAMLKENTQRATLRLAAEVARRLQDATESEPV